jgi:uncharacterized protein (TIGR00290 family)
MTRTPIVLAWSGGKDSSLALAALRDSLEWDPVALLTTVTADYDRISMHGIRRDVLEAQVAAIGMPLELMTMPAQAANTGYEEAFAGSLARLSSRFPGVRHIAFGDLFLADVRQYRETLCARLGWTPTFPLWGLDTAALARRFVVEGFRAVLTCVDTQQLDARYAGSAYDEALLSALPASADPCGENGEFHTLVLDGPIFHTPVEVAAGERVLRDGRFAYCDFFCSARSD